MKNHLLGICALMAMCFAGCSFGDDEHNDTDNKTEVSCSANQHVGPDGKCAINKSYNDTCSSNDECSTGLCHESVCACTESADCSAGEYCENKKCVSTCPGGCDANKVCDAGTCRDVVDCPDNDGKCFKALQLTPPKDPENQWNVGPISLTNESAGDFLGSAYEIILPKEHVITCKGLIDYYKGEKKFCDERSEECKNRKHAGCYQLDMETLIPFTLKKKSTSQKGGQWDKHNIYYVMELSDTGLMSDDEVFTIHMASTPEVTSDHLGTNALEMNKTVDSKNPAKLIAKYDVEKCSPDDPKYNTSVLPSEYKNCDEAYQFMLELKHKNAKPNWTCDPLYKNIMGCTDDVCNYAKDCQKDSCNISLSCKDNEACSGDKYYGFMYSNFADPTNKDIYWHTCRTAKAKLNSMAVYIAIKDAEISKGK